jgi:hypothetical protein
MPRRRPPTHSWAAQEFSGVEGGVRGAAAAARQLASSWACSRRLHAPRNSSSRTLAPGLRMQMQVVLLCPSLFVLLSLLQPCLPDMPAMLMMPAWGLAFMISVATFGRASMFSAPCFAVAGQAQSDNTTPITLCCVALRCVALHDRCGTHVGVCSAPLLLPARKPLVRSATRVARPALGLGV